jgi:hypothetical protein
LGTFIGRFSALTGIPGCAYSESAILRLGYLKGGGMREAIRYAWHGSGKRWDAGIQQVTGSAAGGLLVYLLGIKVPQEILDNPSLGALAAIVVGGFTGVIITFVLRLSWYGIFHHLRIKLNPWLIGVSFGAIIMIGATAGYFWDQSRGPILWDWNFRWINYGYLAARNRIEISRFEIVGENRWDDPIIILSAFVRSDITNENINMNVHLWRSDGDNPGWSPTTTDIIPAKGRFLLYGKFNPDPDRYDGILDNEFKERFGQFSFFFNSKLVKRFYASDVDKLIRKMFEDSTAKPH